MLTAEDVVKRIATERAFIDERGALAGGGEAARQSR
jgi:hypothetical protein